MLFPPDQSLFFGGGLFFPEPGLQIHIHDRHPDRGIRFQEIQAISAPAGEMFLQLKGGQGGSDRDIALPPLFFIDPLAGETILAAGETDPKSVRSPPGAGDTVRTALTRSRENGLPRVFCRRKPRPPLFSIPRDSGAPLPGPGPRPDPGAAREWSAILLFPARLRVTSGRVRLIMSRISRERSMSPAAWDSGPT